MSFHIPDNIREAELELATAQVSNKESVTISTELLEELLEIHHMYEDLRL